eukprot:6836711-Alexandrium_andersonii.AAC.1
MRDGHAPPHLRFGWSIDTRKAYDNTHPELVLAVLEHWGMDRGLLRALSHQRCSQVRWISMAGGIHPEPVEGCRALPQGDPWRPIGLLAVLAAPASRVEQALGRKGLQV